MRCSRVALSARLPLLVLLVVVALAAAPASARQVKSFRDADCGWHGITQQECTDKGCVWIPNFAGPWCQHADSPFVPGNIYLGIHSQISDHQKMILYFGIVAGIVLTTIVILNEFGYNALHAATQAFRGVVTLDRMAVMALLLISFTSRYYRLDIPAEVAFDEFYFGHFANAYCNRIYVFDIHPPLAKLTHYLVGTWLGHECTFDFHGKEGHDQYHNPVEYVHLREVSAFFGSVAIPLMYATARKLGLSPTGSALAAGLLFADTLLLSETRLVLTDSQLFFYILLSIFCALNLWHTNHHSNSAIKKAFWTIATAASSGAALGVKMTALATLAWIGFVTITAAFGHLKPLTIKRCVVASVIAAVVFVVPFYFHIKLGVHSGDADWNIDWEHQRLLVGNEHYDPRAKPPNFFTHLIYLLDRMVEQNRMSLGDHPYASYWYQWLQGKGALLAYSEHHEEQDFHAHIFIISNKFVNIPILLSIALFLFLSLHLLRTRTIIPMDHREHYFIVVGGLLLLGWVANIVPYALVERTTYSYHYLPGQIYGMLLLSLVVEFTTDSIANLLSILVYGLPGAPAEAKKAEEKATAQKKAEKKEGKKEKGAVAEVGSKAVEGASPYEQQSAAKPAPSASARETARQQNSEGGRPHGVTTLYIPKSHVQGFTWFKPLIVILFIAVLMWSFFYWSPFSYGIPLTQFEFAMRNSIIDQGVLGM